LLVKVESADDVDPDVLRRHADHAAELVALFGDLAVRTDVAPVHLGSAEGPGAARTRNGELHAHETPGVGAHRKLHHVKRDIPTRLVPEHPVHVALTELPDLRVDVALRDELLLEQRARVPGHLDHERVELLRDGHARDRVRELLRGRCVELGLDLLLPAADAQELLAALLVSRLLARHELHQPWHGVDREERGREPLVGEPDELVKLLGVEQSVTREEPRRSVVRDEQVDVREVRGKAELVDDHHDLREILRELAGVTGLAEPPQEGLVDLLLEMLLHRPLVILVREKLGLDPARRDSRHELVVAVEAEVERDSVEAVLDDGEVLQPLVRADFAVHVLTILGLVDSEEVPLEDRLRELRSLRRGVRDVLDELGVNRVRGLVGKLLALHELGGGVGGIKGGNKGL